MQIIRKNRVSMNASVSWVVVVNDRWIDGRIEHPEEIDKRGREVRHYSR